MLIIKNADNDDQEIKPFTFTKQYDLELRGFSPLHKLFEFIKYDDTISNYEQWYSEIMSTCHTNEEDNTDHENKATEEKNIYEFVDDSENENENENENNSMDINGNDNENRYTQNTHTINNYFDDSMDDSVQIERIIILMNIIKKVILKISKIIKKKKNIYIYIL